MKNKLLNITAVLMAIGVLAASTQMYSRPIEAAALDCTETVNVQVHIYDDGHPNVNGGLLNLGGAYVDFSDNIADGGREAIRYYDNGPLDDDDRRGVIEERTACRDLDTIGVTVTLGFRENLDCVAVTPKTQEIDLYEDVEVSYIVDDCVRIEPSATPSPVPATSTAVPATSTPVPPAPTLQPVQSTPTILKQCPDGQLVQPSVACAVPVAPTLAPVAVTPSRITPPATGDGGLLP